MIFEPVDLIAKLAALVPRPRVNLTRYKCRLCGGNARVIAETSDRAIEDKAIIDKIHNASSAKTAPLPQVRAPPVADLFS